MKIKTLATAMLCLGLLAPTKLLRDKKLQNVYLMEITITAYSSEPEQTDNTPTITASGATVSKGTIALSRDLLTEYGGSPYSFHDTIWVHIPKSARLQPEPFRVEDTMAPRWKQRADLWFETRETAERWGVRRGMVRV
jgi:3D (Asp-Asp-Asp) domain-containing protein